MAIYNGVDIPEIPMNGYPYVILDYSESSFSFAYLHINKWTVTDGYVCTTAGQMEALMLIDGVWESIGVMDAPEGEQLMAVSDVHWDNYGLTGDYPTDSPDPPTITAPAEQLRRAFWVGYATAKALYRGCG